MPNELRYDLKKMKRNKREILKLDEDANILGKALFTAIQSTRVHHHLKHAWNSTRIHLKTVHQAILVETVKSCSLNLSLLCEVYCSQTVICNILIESANRCKILPRPAVSSGLTVVELERDLKYTGHVSLEPVHPLIAYQALTYLESYNKFSEDISISKDLSREAMFKFSDVVEIQGQSESATKKIISDGKEMTGN